MIFVTCSRDYMYNISQRGIYVLSDVDDDV